MTAANVTVSNLGAGTMTIQNTSSVQITNNLMIGAQGTVNLSGGTLRFDDYSRASGGVLNYTGGTIQMAGTRAVGSGGSPDIIDIFGASPTTIPTGKTLIVEGGLSTRGNVNVTGGKLQSLSNFFWVGNSLSSTLSITNGGTVTAATDVIIGKGGGGDTVIVDGATSSFTTPAGLIIGTLKTGNLQVTNGGSVTSADGRLEFSGAADNSTATINGAGSSWTITNNLSVEGAGVNNVNIQNGGLVYVGNQLSIGDLNNVNLDGGALRFSSIAASTFLNRLNFNSGTIQLSGNRTIGSDAYISNYYGASALVPTGKGLTVEGTATLSSTLTLDGGTLTVGGLVNNNGTFNFIAGTLAVTQVGASFNAPIVSGSSSTIILGANNISLGSAASFTGFNHQGVLNVGANTVTLNSAGYARLGTLTSLAGGTINAPNGIYISGGGNVVGSGTVSARVTGDTGSVIEATGALALGNAASPAGFNYDGELRTKQFAVTLGSSAAVGIGNLTTLGNGATPGTLNATNGFVVDFDEAVTGYGTINSTNTLAKRATINGAVQGNSVAQPITLSGYIKGVGTLTNVTGTYSPGLSATVVSAGNLAFASTSTLIMDLGGTTAGAQYDQIQASGALALGGSVNVSLINGFSPAAGNSFNLFDWGALSGAFATLSLPSLTSGRRWDVSQLHTTGALSVLPAFAADFEEDGDVDAADLTRWKTGFGLSGATHMQGDADGDVDSDGADFLTWQRQLGSAPVHAAAATVPEPGAAAMVSLVGCGLAVGRKRHR